MQNELWTPGITFRRLAGSLKAQTVKIETLSLGIVPILQPVTVVSPEKAVKTIEQTLSTANIANVAGFLPNPNTIARVKSILVFNYAHLCTLADRKSVV